ncbi:MAG: type II toxin-antitoxin system Phd/YefM family antitoxin [Ferrovibrio sp.]|nr:type II toxin-antitoxin system Phd/YefM family antitoxin [Ferrovibrio sp.]
MLTSLPDLDTLPSQTATQVKNKWSETVRMVQRNGSVAVTNHATVEMVLVAAETYQRMAAEIEQLKAREAGKLDELSRRFDANLASLQQPQAADRVSNLFAAKGKLTARPKAGGSY